MDRNFNTSSDNGKFAKRLAKFLGENTTLQYLSITGEKGKHLKEHLSPIFAGLAQNSGLTALDASKNSCGDGPLSYLAEALRTNTTLKWFDLDRSKASVEGWRAIKYSLSFNTTLDGYAFPANDHEKLYAGSLPYIMVHLDIERQLGKNGNTPTREIPGGNPFKFSKDWVAPGAAPALVPVPQHLKTMEIPSFEKQLVDTGVANDVAKDLGKSRRSTESAPPPLDTISTPPPPPIQETPPPSPAPAPGSRSSRSSRSDSSRKKDKGLKKSRARSGTKTKMKKSRKSKKESPPSSAAPLPLKTEKAPPIATTPIPPPPDMAPPPPANIPPPPMSAPPAPKAPSAPAAPPNSSKPPPPTAGRAGLLGAIQGFKKGKLAKAQVNDRSAPKV